MKYRRIKDLREDNDYTQEYVSKFLKLNRVVYSRYETGTRDIPTDVLIRLSQLYNVNIDYILGKTNIKNYDTFLKEIKEIEENEKCRHCNEEELISVNPIDYDFMCRKCGITDYYKK